MSGISGARRQRFIDRAIDRPSTVDVRWTVLGSLVGGHWVQDLPDSCHEANAAAVTEGEGSRGCWRHLARFADSVLPAVGCEDSESAICARAAARHRLAVRCTIRLALCMSRRSPPGGGRSARRPARRWPGQDCARPGGCSVPTSRDSRRGPAAVVCSADGGLVTPATTSPSDPGMLRSPSTIPLHRTQSSSSSSPQRAVERLAVDAQRT
jgi:hypothetical protein